MIDHHIMSMLYEVKKQCETYKRKYKHCHGCIYSLIDKEEDCIYCALNRPDLWELNELEKKGVI